VRADPLRALAVRPVRAVAARGEQAALSFERGCGVLHELKQTGPAVVFFVPSGHDPRTGMKKYDILNCRS
jgi:hypothetical protein